jgi:hypothetical protein
MYPKEFIEGIIVMDVFGKLVLMSMNEMDLGIEYDKFN